MATATRTRKAPAKVQETVEEVEVQETELTPKQVINAGIEKVVQATGVDTQKARYKAMRAIAYQAFLEAIEGDDFDGLVDRAIAGADELPTGWTLERAAKAEVASVLDSFVTSPPRKPAAAEKATPARRRPARKTV